MPKQTKPPLGPLPTGAQAQGQRHSHAVSALEETKDGDAEGAGAVKLMALDLFCGAGGATKGLQRAGFHVTGVDIKPQPRYCGDAFHQADAMEFPLEGYDFIWASPPCQGYSRLRHLPWLKDKKWPLLIEPIRAKLNVSGAEWVIENVEDAPLDGFMLCGQMFGLPVYRHRVFETSFGKIATLHNPHHEVIGHGRMVNDRRKGTRIVTVASGLYKKADGERALGIYWMNKAELSQAIPPAYSEFIGKQAMQAIRSAA